MQDSVFLCFLATNVRGDLIDSKEGENIWISVDELKDRDDLFNDVRSDNPELRFSEEFSFSESIDVAEGF